MEFSFAVEQYQVRGFIDRIDIVAPGEYRVVDYKTNKNPKYLNDFQLQLYALALKDKIADLQPPIHGSYVLLKHQSSTLDFTFSEQDLTSTFSKVLELGKTIDSENTWQKKPSVLCNWCDYRSICQDVWIEKEIKE